MGAAVKSGYYTLLAIIFSANEIRDKVYTRGRAKKLYLISIGELEIFSLFPCLVREHEQQQQLLNRVTT